MPPHFVYVLESLSNPGRHYIGLATDIGRRLRAHNDGFSSQTATHRPWRLLVAIRFADAATALRFEKFLKTGSGRAFARHHFFSGGSLVARHSPRGWLSFGRLVRLLPPLRRTPAVRRQG